MTELYKYEDWALVEYCSENEKYFRVAHTPCGGTITLWTSEIGGFKCFKCLEDTGFVIADRMMKVYELIK